MLKKKLLNLSINVFNFSLKGFFFILGAKYLSIQDLGKLGIFFSYVSIFVFFIGFEYWYFSNRKIAIAYSKKKYQLIKLYIYNQFYFTFIIILFTSIFIYFIFNNSFSEINFLIILFSIYFQYIIQEISRFLILTEDQILSSLASLSFAIWAIPVYFIWFILNIQLTYENIIMIYFINISIFCFIWISILFNKFNLNIKEFIELKKYFNISLQKRAIKLSFIMFLSVVSYKISELSPRVFLDVIHNYKIAGIITFYQSFSLLSVGLIYQFVSVFYVPSLLKEKNNNLIFENIASKFKKNIIYFSFIFFIISSFIPFVFIEILNIHKEYLKYYYVFLIFNFSYLLVNISSYYASIAYAKNLDIVNYMTNIFVFIVILFLYIIFSILHIFNTINIIVIVILMFGMIQLVLKKYLLHKYKQR